MRVEQIMTREVLTVGSDTPLKGVAHILSSHHISGLPVCGADGAVLGVVSEADILRKEEGVPADAGRRFAWLFRRLDGELDKVAARTAGEAMTAPALTIRPLQSVSEAAKLMLARRVNRLPVVDGERLVGIVTRADLVRAFHRSDEEIEKEIRDDVLMRMLWIPPEMLRLRVEDGVVELTGTVDTLTDAELVTEFVRRVPGVVDTRFDLRARVTDERRSRPTHVVR